MNMEATEIWIKFEEMTEILGTEHMLECIVLAMPIYDLEEYLRYIDRTQELGYFD